MFSDGLYIIVKYRIVISTEYLMEALGGFDFDVVGNVAQDYVCPICLLLLRDPVELACTHTMCKHCLNGWIQNCDERLLWKYYGIYRKCNKNEI